MNLFFKEIFNPKYFGRTKTNNSFKRTLLQSCRKFLENTFKNNLFLRLKRTKRESERERERERQRDRERERERASERDR